MEVRFTIQVPKCAELEARLQHVTAKIDRLLKVFQPELVHLHGRLTRHRLREGVICSLDLSLPTGRLAAEETASTAQAALGAAAQDLTEQVKRHKERLRREQGRGGHATVRTWAPADELPPAAADLGQQRRDLSQYIAANLASLMSFVTRQIHLQERLGTLRHRQLEPREVLDEMIVEALGAGDGNHPDPPRWFYLLAVTAIRRLAGLTDQQYGGERADSLDRDLNEAETQREERQYEFFAPDEEVRLRDITPDSSSTTPEEIAYSNELVTLLQAALLRLPPRQREDLVLFALEGFTLDELALLSRRRPEQVRKDLLQANEELQRQSDIPGELRRVLVEQTGQRLATVA